MTKNASLPAITNLFHGVASDENSRAFLRQVFEVLLWGAVGLAVTFSMLTFRPKPLWDDSFQYLNVAANIRSGNGIATNLVYFDAERSHGRIPAPLTTFPPGYPALVAMLADLAGGTETAARGLSAICFAGTAALLAFILIAVRITVFARTTVMLFFVANAVSADFSTAVLSESMFVFIFTAAIVVLSRAWWGFPCPRGHLPWIIAGLTLAGLSYWIRYAGLFLILAVVLYIGLRHLRLRGRVGASELCATLIPIALAGILIARNVLLVGNWKGGNDLQVSHPLHGVMANFARDQLHLLLGEHAVKFGVWEGLLLIGLLGLIALLARVLIRGGLEGNTVFPWAHGFWTLPLTCAVVYSAGLCYAGLHTVITLGTRMFLPVLPLYLMLFGLMLHWLNSRARFTGGQLWFRAALCALAIGYIGVNARDLKDPQLKSRLDSLSALFAEQTGDGQRLSDWVNAHIVPAAVIAAQDGQATGYFLHRRTLGLVESEYSAERWECPEIRTQMSRFGARYLVLYRHPDNNSRLLEESRFAAAAASGQPGCGFVIASENQDVRILEVAPLPATGGSQ
jgi:hypothetical protein